MTTQLKMTAEKQDEFIDMIPDSTPEQHRLKQQAINAAVLSGIIDPPNVLAYRRAVKTFRSTDPDTVAIRDKAVKLAGREESVLILGESGTGKELLARIMHGERRGLFVPVNVCAVTDTLFESELFGHIRGAFTGADKDRQGLIAEATGGTLFLDEIGDMPLALQAKLLRVIQHKEFRKVGSNIAEKMTCRIVAATHRDLRSLTLTKEFRLDFYERLNVFSLRIKPLRDRLTDLSLYGPADLLAHIQSLPHWKTYFEDGHTPDWRRVYPLLSGNVRQMDNLKLRWEVFGKDGIGEEDIM